MDQIKILLDHKDQIDAFVYEVYHTFNGKTNIYNLANLITNWTVKSGTIMGNTTNPNTIIIYPLVIGNYFAFGDEYDWAVIVTVIHELYHADQVIYYDRLLKDRVYLDHIEKAAERMALEYCILHMNIICNKFHVRSKTNDFIQVLNKYYDTDIYHRKSYIDHIISMLLDIINIDIMRKRMNELIQYLESKNTDFIITINNEKLYIKNKTQYTDLFIVNEFMYNHLFKYDIRSVKGDILLKDYVCTISIKAKGENVLCRLKEGH